MMIIQSSLKNIKKIYNFYRFVISIVILYILKSWRNKKFFRTDSQIELYSF